MKKKLLIALLVVCLVVAMLPAAFATGGVEATIGKTEYATLEAAIEAANASTVAVTVKVEKSVTLESTLVVNNANGKKITINCNDRTISGAISSPLLELVGPVDIKSGIVKNTQAGGTAVLTDGSDKSVVALSNMTLICTGSGENTALVCAGTGENSVTLSTCTLDAAKTGCGLYVDGASVKVTASNSTINGKYGIIVAAASTVELKNTDVAAKSRPVDGTTMIVVAASGAKVTADSSSAISNSKGVAIALDATTDVVVTIACPVSAAKNKIMTGWDDSATVSFSNADVKAALGKEGYAFNNNVVDGKGIVIIGTAPYASLETAFAKGGTVVLLEDVNEDVVVPSGKSIVLDLAGFNLSGDIEVKGTLTLTNSKKTGEYTGDLLNNGTLTIKSVIVNGDITNVRTLKVESGEIYGSIDASATTASTSISGGKVTSSGVAITSAKTLAVTGGEITGGESAVVVTAGTASISSSAKLTGTSDDAILVTGGTLTVNAGTITGGSCALRVTGGKAEVKGGGFSGDVTASAGATLSIKGGYYTADVTEYCPKNSKGEHTSVAVPGSYVVNGVDYDYMIGKKLPEGVVVGATEAEGSTIASLSAAAKAMVADLIANVEAEGLGDLAIEKALSTAAANATDVRRYNNGTGASITDPKDLTVVIVPTVFVQVTKYADEEFTLNITAGLVTKLTTDPDNMTDSNTVQVTKSNIASADLARKSITITLPLADGMSEGYIRRELEDNSYYCETENSYGAVTFTTTDGLGTFVLTEVAPVAMIGEVGYESLRDAVAAVKDGETIVLIGDCTETVKINKEVYFTLEIEYGVDFTGYLRPGSDYDDENADEFIFDIVEDARSSGGDDDDDDLEIEVEGDDDEDEDEDEKSDFNIKTWKNPYTDVATTSWYYKAVGYVTHHGMMNGTGKGLFDPEETVTRGMVVTMLARLDGVDTETGSVWYEAGMEWAIRNDLIAGGDPNGAIEREEIMVIMWKFMGAPLMKGDWISDFADVNKVSSSGEDAVNWAVGIGLIEGDGKRLNPEGLTRRNELATMFMRFCDDILEL